MTKIEAIINIAQTLLRARYGADAWESIEQDSREHQIVWRCVEKAAACLRGRAGALGYDEYAACRELLCRYRFQGDELEPNELDESKV